MLSIYLQDILRVEANPLGERLNVDGLHDLVGGTLLRRHSDINNALVLISDCNSITSLQVCSVVKSVL